MSNFLRHKQLPSYVTEELLDALVETVVEPQGDEAEPYLAALRRCKAKLSPADEELIELHYVDDLGSRQIADRLQRPQTSVCEFSEPNSLSGCSNAFRSSWLGRSIPGRNTHE